MSTPHRRVAWGTLVAGAAAFVVLAVLLVPWEPVPGGMPAPVAAADYFPAAHLAEAESLARTARLWSWSSLLVGLAVACWLGFGRRGARLVGRLPGPWWVVVVLAVTGLSLLGRVVTLPFALLLHDAYVEHGISTQSTGPFLVDVAKGEGVAVVVTSLVVLVLVGCARRWRRAWPAVAGGVLGALVLAGSFAYPVLVEPLFNSFTPMADGPLRTEILALADREGVEVDDVLVADASRRTTTLNAYVSGIGSTRRVVVYDTLVEGLPDDEALSVVAHELAHARHDDVLLGSALAVAGTVFGVGLLGLLLGAGRRGGRRSMADPRVVPLVLALSALATLAAAPVQNTVSRQIETRADVDALRATDDPDAFVALQRQLSLRSLNDPTPPAWSQVVFGSHPTVLQRIAIAERLR
jgi:STE24 endopeptidase